MAGDWKDEFPPLLPIGFHQMTLADLNALCVARFPHSVTRPTIMAGLSKVIETLNTSGLNMEVWIDGSFLTEKLNPDDSDIVVRVTASALSAATPAQIRVVHWVSKEDLKPTLRCDSYCFVEYEQGHPLASHGEWDRAYWIRQFGMSRRDEPKGMAVVKLPFIVV